MRNVLETRETEPSFQIHLSCFPSLRLTTHSHPELILIPIYTARILSEDRKRCLELSVTSISLSLISLLGELLSSCMMSSSLR